MVEFGETLYEEVLKQVPHRQWVFSIPKRLRVYFMYDRKLLGRLSQCAWKVLSAYLKVGVSIDDPKPGAVIAVQTFGDFLMTWHHSGFNVYCGDSILPSDQEGIERLAQYVVRAPISQERMTYIPRYESTEGVAYVIYEAKAGDRTETFTALDWLARLLTHIPNRGEQLVRYFYARIFYTIEQFGNKNHMFLRIEKYVEY